MHLSVIICSDSHVKQAQVSECLLLSAGLDLSKHLARASNEKHSYNRGNDYWKQ